MNRVWGCMAGRRWGYDSIWLHRDEENEAATQLYAKLGYQTQRSAAGFAGALDRRVLLRKGLQPWQPSKQPEVEASGAPGPDGVFIWQQRPSDTS